MENITLSVSKDDTTINLVGEGLSVDYSSPSLAVFVYKDFIFKALSAKIGEMGNGALTVIKSIDHVVRNYLEGDTNPLKYEGYVFEFVRKEV